MEEGENTEVTLSGFRNQAYSDTKNIMARVSPDIQRMEASRSNLPLLQAPFSSQVEKRSRKRGAETR